MLCRQYDTVSEHPGAEAAFYFPRWAYLLQAQVVSQITLADHNLSHAVPKSSAEALSLDRASVVFPSQQGGFGPPRTRGIRRSSRDNARYALDCLGNRTPSRPRAVMDTHQNIQTIFPQFEQSPLIGGVKYTYRNFAKSQNPHVVFGALQTNSSLDTPPEDATGRLSWQRLATLAGCISSGRRRRRRRARRRYSRIRRRAESKHQSPFKRQCVSTRCTEQTSEPIAHRTSASATVWMRPSAPPSVSPSAME